MTEMLKVQRSVTSQATGAVWQKLEWELSVCQESQLVAIERQVALQGFVQLITYFARVDEH